MKFLSSTALGLAILARTAAALVLEAEPLEIEPLNTTSLEKRDGTAPWHFCNDKEWKRFGERAYLAGVRLMGRTDDDKMRLTYDARKEIPDQYFGTRGMCTNLWCGGDQGKGRAVVFYLCLKPETPDTFFNSGDLAQKFHDGFYDCNGGEPRDDGGSTQAAFHVWDNGYDLHVEGGYENMRCPEDMKKNRWPRPDSLNYYPYTTTPKPT